MKFCLCLHRFNTKKSIMKKLFVAAFVIGAVTVVTSCKKDYTCECTVLGFTGDTTLVDYSKKDAKAYCDGQNTAAAIFGGSCSLK